MDKTDQAILESQLIDPEYLKQSLKQKRDRALEYLGKKWILHPECNTKYDRNPVILKGNHASLN